MTEFFRYSLYYGLPNLYHQFEEVGRYVEFSISYVYTYIRYNKLFLHHTALVPTAAY